MKPRVLILLLMIALCPALCGGCNDSSGTVVFRFREGFYGLILMSEDQSNGLELTRNNGKYYVDVPENGKLVVKSLKPFTKWHKLVAQLSNGSMLSEEQAQSSAIALYELPYVSGRGAYFFLGTASDYKKVSRKYDFEKLPLATKAMNLDS